MLDNAIPMMCDGWLLRFTADAGLLARKKTVQSTYPQPWWCPFERSRTWRGRPKPARRMRLPRLVCGVVDCWWRWRTQAKHFPKFKANPRRMPCCAQDVHWQQQREWCEAKSSKLAKKNADIIGPNYWRKSNNWPDATITKANDRSITSKYIEYVYNLRTKREHITDARRYTGMRHATRNTGVLNPNTITHYTHTTLESWYLQLFFVVQVVSHHRGVSVYCQCIARCISVVVILLFEIY
jgi:hypothetical protein